MAIVPIRTFGDPALRQKARPVERVGELHRRIAGDMLETMRDAPGVGLAGPQIGVLERIFVWEVEEDHGTLINPVITWRSDDEVEGEEGCLSLPGIYYPVMRARAVRVEGIDQGGEPVRFGAEDLLARVCQHEIDHLDGVLFIDHLPSELRREALTRLREEALGLPPSQPPKPHPVEEQL